MEENAKKKRWPWVVGAVVIVCAVAVALIVWMNVSGSEETDSVLAETGKAGAVENSNEENDFEEEKLSPESFKGTEAEYYAELDKRMPAGPELADYAVIHKDENGIPYREQLIDIFFKGDVSESEAQRIISNFGGEYAGGFFGLAGLDEILAYSIFPEGTDVLSLSKQIAELPEVNTAAPSYYIKGESASYTSDSYVEDQYYLTTCGFGKAWNSVRAGREISIAVLDTGIDFDHPDLYKNIDIAAAFDAWHNYTISVPMDGSGKDPGYELASHGSMVSGIASACTNNGKGIAGCSYGARIVPICVIDDGNQVGDDGLLNSEGYSWKYIYNAVLRLQYMINKPDVVNMSFVFNYCDQDLTPRIQNIIKNLRTQYGMVFVAAVGNHNSSELRWPAALDGVIGVGAVGENGSSRWTESNGLGSAFNQSVDLCAPGQNILTTYNITQGYSLSRSAYEIGYCTKSGTSLAAPQVAAAAALVKAKNPSLSASGVESFLFSTAKDLGAAGRDNEFGYGLLDVSSLGSGSTGGGSGSSGTEEDPPTGVDPYEEFMKHKASEQ